MALIDLDHWHEILQTLRRNRLRTFLTACGVFWGVFMLVVMLGVGRGLERGVEADFGVFAFNTVFVWGQRTGMPYAGQQPGRQLFLTTDDAERLRQLPGIELVLPRNFLGGFGGRTVVSRLDKSQSFGVTAEEPDYLRLEPLEMARGRFLNPDDLGGSRKVAVVGRRVVEALFADGSDPIGGRIIINGFTFTVVGVYKTDESGPRGDWVAGRIFVPRTTFVRTYGGGNRVSGIAMLVRAGFSSTEVEEQARVLLSQRHRVHPQDIRAFGSFNRDKEFRKVSGLFLAIQGLSWFVGMLTLLAGALGVSNIMMIAVAERTREIGIRKAVGATPFAITTQIVAESTVLTGLAGYLGLVVGVGVLEIVARVMKAMPKSANGPSLFGAPEIDIGVALLAAGVLTAAGAFAGLAPARAAVAIRPVEALAHE
jgi:putative ABC transport system permease protein